MSRDRGYSGDLTAGVRRCPEEFGPPFGPPWVKGGSLSHSGRRSLGWDRRWGWIAYNQLAVTGRRPLGSNSHHLTILALRRRCTCGTSGMQQPMRIRIAPGRPTWPSRGSMPVRQPVT